MYSNNNNNTIKEKKHSHKQGKREDRFLFFMIFIYDKVFSIIN